MFYYEHEEVHTPRCDKQKKHKESGVPGSYNTCFFGGFSSGKLEWLDQASNELANERQFFGHLRSPNVWKSCIATTTPACPPARPQS
jgi:hypothetical protein